MNHLKSSKMIAALGLAATLVIAGCVLHKVSTVTPDGAGGFTTNTTTQVDEVVLDAYCAGLQLVGTPSLVVALQKDPSARPIVTDIQTALNGAINGADTNVVATIQGFLGGNQALDNQLAPLIKAASDLRGKLIAKYGDKAGVQITMAIMKTDLAIVTGALDATK